MSNFSDLLATNYKSLVSQYLEEDVPSFDYGGYVVGQDPKTATLYIKAEGVVAGIPFFDQVFEQLDCKVQWFVQEGDHLSPETKMAIAKVSGGARNILLGERTALNILSRCSGIALRARKVHELQTSKGFQGIIAATRKTTPGFRLVEKYGVLVGGLDTHRMDLSSMVMLKDNHIWSTGSITQAVQKARSACGFSLKIEVECQTEQEADEAIEAGADIIMLDNFTGQGLKSAAKSIKERWATKGKTHFLIESSGGITFETCENYFCPQVPWTLIEGSYCMKYVFESHGYFVLITDLRLVWFEHCTIEKLKTIASTGHHIEIEKEQDAIRLLTRLESLFKSSLSGSLTVQKCQKTIQIHCKENKAKLNTLSWTFECSLLDQTGEGYTGPDILYQEFMLPSLYMAHHCVQQPLLDTQSMQKAFSPAIFGLFHTLSQKKEPIPSSLPSSHTALVSPPIITQKQTNQDIQEQRRQELAQFFEKPSIVKKKRRL
ncbi:Quinolinate phosphoribosyl transferase [Sporodiniella umbellata]|nr:Quinolinate phosphoribosyl transferase [Sporodiniella umbellata]